MKKTTRHVYLFEKIYKQTFSSLLLATARRPENLQIELMPFWVP